MHGAPRGCAPVTPLYGVDTQNKGPQDFGGGNAEMPRQYNEMY